MGMDGLGWSVLGVTRRDGRGRVYLGDTNKI